MESRSDAESAFPRAEELQDEDGAGLVRCPICGSGQTWLHRSDVVDLEYFVVPPRHFNMRKCGGCGSEFLDPRPLESELPPFYPSDYHAYNENHDGLARLLVQFRARSRARSYGRLIQNRPGRIFDVGTGDCRHFDELRRHLDLECAGVEIQPDIAAMGRARGYDVLEGTLETVHLTDHVGNYDIVSMNHVLEHVVYPHTMLRARTRSVASRWACHRPAAHRLVVGEQVVRAQLGGLPLPATPADPIQGRAIRSPRGRRVLVGQDPVCTSHPDDHLTPELARTEGLAPAHAQRQDAHLRRSSHGCAAIRKRRMAVRRGRHHRLPSPETPR